MSNYILFRDNSILGVSTDKSGNILTHEHIFFDPLIWSKVNLINGKISILIEKMKINTHDNICEIYIIFDTNFSGIKLYEKTLSLKEEIDKKNMIQILNKRYFIQGEEHYYFNDIPIGWKDKNVMCHYHYACIEDYKYDLIKTILQDNKIEIINHYYAPLYSIVKNSSMIFLEKKSLILMYKSDSDFLVKRIMLKKSIPDNHNLLSLYFSQDINSVNENISFIKSMYEMIKKDLPTHQKIYLGGLFYRFMCLDDYINFEYYNSEKIVEFLTQDTIIPKDISSNHYVELVYLLEKL